MIVSISLVVYYVSEYAETPLGREVQGGLRLRKDLSGLLRVHPTPTFRSWRRLLTL